MMTATWRDVANRVLAELFDNGKRVPTDNEIFDAYPFGERHYFPYKVWCEQVRWWRDGRPVAARTPRKTEPVPEGQEALL